MRLSQDEAWAVLTTSHTGILTTLRADGSPIALPVWFVVLDERVYVGTPAGTKKVARVERDGRASFLVEWGERWAELRGVHLSGTARVVDDPPLVARARAALDAKYSSYRTSGRHVEVPIAVIEIRPEGRILSWDNAQLP